MHLHVRITVICCFLGIVIFQIGQCAPELSSIAKVSSGENVLVISTTTSDQVVTEAEATTVSPSVGSAESWEVDNGDLSSGVEHVVPASKVIPRVNIKSTKPEIYSFRVQSDIKYRYSRTHVTSRVANKDTSKSQESRFRVVLPETAFISKFTMEIDGKSYEAYVKEKEEARKVYSQAQSQGQSAGLVEVSTRNSNTFNVNVNIKAQSKVTFNLTYEELLSRRLGRYEQVINISPEHVASVKDFQIVVNIEESQNITHLRVPNLRNDIESEADSEGNNKDAIVVQSENKANISWSPSVQDQEQLSSQGVGGKFVVQYDINRNSTSGEVLVMEGYFVHFFAPEKLKPLRKHVVFILDISGSMWGRKMEQLKDSQKRILSDLNPDDFFNIITFSSDVFLWSPNDSLENKPNSDWYPSYFSINSKPMDFKKQQPYPATKENIEKAKEFINSLVASGGTNIHDSIVTAINLTSVIKQARDGIVKKSIETTIINETSSESTNSMVEIITMTAGSSSSAEVVTEGDINPTTTQPPVKESKNVLPPNVESLIMFLTDGEPTVGVTDPPYIQQLIKEANKNLSIPIFSLGFGEGADFPFLRKLSLQNYGFARKIYEASDAALQLKGFYNEIASPLLSNVLFNYTSPEYNVSDLTVTSFPNIFGGTEIAVAGKLIPRDESVAQPAEMEVTEGTTEPQLTDEVSNNDVPEHPFDDNAFVLTDKHLLDVGILGNGRDGAVSFKPPQIFCRPIDFDIIRPFPPRPTPPPTSEDKFLERLWAYLTIQQLIEKDLRETNVRKNDIESGESSTASTILANKTNNVITKPDTPKQQAIKIALKYGFVTPFTSLVVVKPNTTDVTDTIPGAAVTTEEADSQSAPMSMQYYALALPAQAQPLLGKVGVRNRISSHSGGSHFTTTSTLSNSRPLYMSQIRPGPFQGFQIRPTMVAPLMSLSTTMTVPQASSETKATDYESQIGEAYSTSFEIETTTQKYSTLTLEDIQWFNSSNPIVRVNETDYKIAFNESNDELKDNAGYECNSVSEYGKCVHLRDCISHEFVSDFPVFVNSFFCSIQSENSYYAGICCSDKTPTTTTPNLLP